LWDRWFAAAGLRVHVTPVASFNDAGMMLQAAEQNLGLVLARELLAADALCDGRLVKLSPLSITHEQAHPYHLVYPPAIKDWPPLMKLRQWLHDELEMSRQTLHPPAKRAPAKRRAATVDESLR
jgi:LysR family transcriptional regulator, glycine cleavage system transcriptional activator